MFLQNLKNIFTSLKTNNSKSLEKSMDELENTINIIQIGGDTFFQRLKSDIDPVIKKLQLNLDYLKLSIQIINFIQEYLSKMDLSKFDDLRRLNDMLSEMKITLESRILDT